MYKDNAMTQIYGIPNCNTVKKARQWLAAHNIEAEFIDFKKTPPAAAQLIAWLNAVSADVLINRKGTTWRKLSPEQQQSCTSQNGAIAVMQAHPSVIKRPVLLHQNQVYVGFTEADYARIFQTPNQS